MKRRSQTFFNLSLILMLLSSLGYAHPKMALSVDPFIPGARGLAAKGEFEIAIIDNLSLIVPFRGVWIDSEKFSFLFKSGYAHIDPYNYMDNILKLFESKDIIREKEFTTGIGFKLYPNSKPLQNGFYIKPVFTMGYAWLDFEHVPIVPASLTRYFFTFTDKVISEKIQSAVFIPEILIGYNITFASHLIISLEIGAKYRLFYKQEFATFVPRLTGLEPSLSLMLGYTW
jgi:hypothetical protein